PAHAAAWSEFGVVNAAAGRLAEAVACYDKALELDPGEIDALNNRGNALVALNRPTDALASYDRALARKPGFVEALNNRGGLLRELERPAEALATLDKALAIRPDYSDALANRGNALVDLDRAAEALESYDRALAVNPAAANALANRANALTRLGRLSEAVESYDRAIAQNPQNVEAWSNRGNALRELERYGEAVQSLLKAISLSPNHAGAFNILGNTLLDQKRPAEALALYDRTLALRPDYAEAHCNRATALIALKRPAEALASADRALALKPDFVEALNNRATALIEIKRPAEALASCDRALALKPGYAEAHCNRGVAISDLDRQEESLAHFDKAIALRPNYALAYENKGVALLQLGRVAEASAAIDAAVTFAPTRAQSYYHAAMARRFERGDPRFGPMEDLALENSPLDADERTYAHFALGKAYADVEDHQRSFRHFSAGAALRRGLCAYDEAEVLGRFERTRLAYTGELMRADHGGDPCPVPVFVVGMPRSGTTLVEQILASHPAVHGAGEINDFDQAAADLGGAAARTLLGPEAVWRMTGEDFRRLGADYLRRIRVGAPAASRIVNKMPDNFRFAGLIALALPNARILHVRRDPVDTCFSCFSTRFTEILPYTYDLAELGRYYRAYEALMGHWRDALPQGMMLEVRYEDVVADLERQVRRILAHCGLEWDARCLDFHRNERTVRTASLAQVRRPLYKSSVGRWRRYEAFLGPLIAALGPSIGAATGAPAPTLAA
ncbi:MAG: tetratricopeptide repeat-containing sulfotransferase family protein, partial [Roseiarcus sp.]